MGNESFVTLGLQGAVGQQIGITGNLCSIKSSMISQIVAYLADEIADIDKPERR